MSWSTACLDWEKRIVAKQSLIGSPLLFPDSAEIGLSIMSQLILRDIPRHPDTGEYRTIGDATAPWALDFSRHFFGSYDMETGKRHITDFFMLISKKNTKSTLAAAIMLTVLILNWRESAEFIILAPTLEVAKNAWRPIKDMIECDPDLQEIVKCQDYIKTVTDLRTGATLRVIASDTATVSGSKAAGVLVDELWEFGKKANADDMLREATGALPSRPEGFVIYLTTQSDKPPAGVFLTKLNYARDVRDGKVIDPRFLPVLYEFPKKYLEKELHLKKENFYITNPNMGVSIEVDLFEREYGKACQEGEEEKIGFLAKRLNVEVGMSLRADRWAGAEFWMRQADKSITLEYILSVCDVVEIGIDGGGLDDLLGLSVLGRDPDTKRWLSWSRAWAHESVLARRKSIESTLRDIEKEGSLFIVENIGDDTAHVAQICKQVYKSNLLDKIGCDPNGIGAILDALLAADIPEDSIVGVGQGWRLSHAVKTAERKLADKKSFFHDGSKLMNFCVGNAKGEIKGNNTLITKQASGTAKIDPFIALLNAVSLMQMNPPSKKDQYQVYIF